MIIVRNSVTGNLTTEIPALFKLFPRGLVLSIAALAWLANKRKALSCYIIKLCSVIRVVSRTTYIQFISMYITYYVNFQLYVI